MGKWTWAILLYLAVSGILLGIRYRRAPRDWLLRWMLVGFFPVVGWLFPLFWPKSWIRRIGEESMVKWFEPDEQSLRRTGIQMRLDTAEELSVLPVEEALLVNEHRDRRAVMINVLKQDAMQYMDILKKAVSNEDSETSHYAVSAVMEIKRKLTLSMQEIAVQYEDNRQDAAVLRSYGEVLKQYMKSGFLDERTLRNYKYTYLKLLDELIALAPDSEFAYPEKMETELEMGLLRDAEDTAKVYLERYPRSEEAYLGLLKVYYSMRSYDQVQTTLDALKRSPLILSNRALTVVRYWSGGVS
ncbi:hypothetical protein V3851_13355 [Paenibacillus sp. M1]|uniref:Uncharacterized protein n=1 Tax=Paenibacillus haidiansis TaxID=1574488 RepID=A0ABU7VTV1_9BACL